MIKKSIIIGALILMLFIMSGFISKLFKGETNGVKNENNSTIVLGMALLRYAEKFDFRKITDELKHHYNLPITGHDYDEEKGIGVIELKNSQIAIALINLPIPGDELEFPTQVAYLWPEAKDLIPKHQAHIIISVSSPVDTKLNMYKTFTKAASAVLANTNSIGIYLGNQTLVLPTDLYVEGTKSMTDDDLPLMNWIYFGLRAENGKHSGYTYGLKEFGFNELEILNSNSSFEDIQGLLFNISHYIIQGNVTLNDGETIGLTADQKIKIRKSKGVQVDGTTLKLEY